MSRDDATLLDLVHHARLLIDILDGFDRALFLDDVRTQLAVTRLFEILGEAVKRPSPAFREQYPEAPWWRISGMRDVLIHSYDRVDLNRVWDAAIDEIPNLLKVIEPLVPQPDSELPKP